RLLLRVRVLRAVQRAAALAVFHAGRVERAADDVVLHRRKVGHRATADEDARVLLAVVADSRDVGRHFHAVGEADAGDLPQGGVRLLGGHGAHDRADAALLGRTALELGVSPGKRVPGGPEGRCVHLLLLELSPLADQLRDPRHGYSLYVCPGRAHANAPVRTNALRFGLLRPRSRPSRGRFSGAARPQSQDRDWVDARKMAAEAATPLERRRL